MPIRKSTKFSRTKKSFPRYDQRDALKKKSILWFSVGLTFSFIILGWILFSQLNIFSESSQGEDSNWQKIKENISKFWQDIDQGVSNLKLENIIGGNKNQNVEIIELEEGEIKNLEEKVFPQFEEK